MDLSLVDAEGRPWHLADHRGHPVVLVFHRHIHWLPCADHVAAVGARRDEFGDDTFVAVVVFTTGPIPAMALPVLRDPDRAAYRALEFGRGSIRRVWGWRAMKAYVRLLRRDGLRSLRRPTEDPQQLGGDVVFDRDGEIAWIHRGAGPDDRPSVDELLDAAQHV